MVLKNTRNIPILLFIFFTFYTFPLRISAQTIEQRFENARAFDQGFSGLLVKDLETNEIVYQRWADKYFVPASNIKLFTFYTGLKILGDSIPALKYWVKQDTLIFTGTGDPSFLNPELPASKVFDFLKHREEKLFYLPPSSAEEHYGPGWAWDDYSSSYSPERSSFPIYGNLATFNFYGNRRTPVVSPRIFQDSIEVKNFYGQKISGIQRDLNRNLFSFQYVNALPKQPRQKLPFRYSTPLLVQLLSDTLNREVQIYRAPPPKPEEANTLFSIPADSLYKKMLQDSDNFIAEQILLLSSQELKENPGAKSSIDFMLKKHLKELPDEIDWVDGSGLSRYNLVTPRTMVALLEKIAEEVEQERLFSLLAVGGESGTLRNNYRARKPYIFAKTGTLLHNHSMSGYLKARSGKILAFSFMNSNFMVPTWEIRREMEIILREIYQNN